MAKLFIFLGSIMGFLSVALGAFGAHGLRDRVTEKLLMNWNTGAQYHMYHAIAMVLVGILAMKLANSAQLNWAGWSFFVGILLFSGSLYAMALTGITKLGAITPLGGLAFLIGWALVAIAALRGA
ncbi:DUF423 domain-containing protein [Brevibacillus dissolubilis]|uniref:DUF423 domain-containing protein n=1 Tax=Brevibacillus dissolubilis TaxID=1844116 RepID=UPI001115C629|nr:DUF423 domain-containing protein [Brevibacillus dissolubilis]